MYRLPLLALVCLACAPTLQAGLYYSGETFTDLPSRWRGFLLDQRALRLIAAKPAAGRSAGTFRTRYLKEVGRLVKLSKQRKLTADEAADLGALYLRLGETAKAVAVLRPAQKSHPVHFKLAANLGTAWQLQEDYVQAALMLRLAVKLAPGKRVKAEELHLKLVQLRGREKRGTQTLDDLFGVRFVGASGKYEPGQLAAAQRKKLPTGAVAWLQQLALWLPGDARLLWLVAELAAALGDVPTAAAITDGCVTEFGLRDRELLAHRKALRAEADKLAKDKTRPDKKKHDGHALLFKPLSSRPLASQAPDLPTIKAKGVNALGWEVLALTTVDRKSRPTFPKYLKELDGKQVVLEGHMQPLANDSDLGAFLVVENPVGCWWCEMPEMTQIVLVEMPEGKSGTFTREPIRLTGKLVLNATDPENFFYTISDARMQILKAD